MSDRRASVKAFFLGGPLIATVLALHAWGDGAATGLNRRVESWQYPEVRQAPFLIRAPRRTSAAEFAGPALREFLEASLKTGADALGLRPPADPVQVVLLGAADADRRRYGGDAAEFLAKYDGLFDPARRAIVVRMDADIDQKRVIAALRKAAARLLLFDAGSARWSSWLTEGLAGALEGSKSTDLREWTGELPSLRRLLAAREADFRGEDGPSYGRGARLLVAYLMETLPEGFAYYYSSVRAEGDVRLSRAIERFSDLDREEALWKDWLRVQK